MSETPQLQQRMAGETVKAYQAYLDYRDMGAGRSQKKLCDQYQTKAKGIPPTKTLLTIKNWSTNWQWQKRLDEWQEHLKAEREAEAEEARQEERARRKKLLDTWHDKIEKQLKVDFKLTTPEGIQAFRALSDALTKYMEQSRKEHNDMPVERTAMTDNEGRVLQPVWNIQVQNPPSDGKALPAPAMKTEKDDDESVDAA